MKKEFLEKEITEASTTLLTNAREMCWNIIPDDRYYIITEISNDGATLFEKIKREKKLNAKKIPQKLSALIPELEQLYPHLYDIDLEIYKVTHSQTVIAIKYYSKSSLGAAYREMVKNKEPTLHCKISMPPYLFDKNKKYDINWHLHLWKLRWKTLVARQRINRLLADMEKARRLRNEIVSILLSVKEKITQGSDMNWTNYADAEELREELDKHIEELKKGSKAVIDNINNHFHATSTFQEHAISNGWTEEYFRLAARFDKAYYTIKKIQAATDKVLFLL